jgi:hypothetical protein
VAAAVTLSCAVPEPPVMDGGVKVHVACDADRPVRERATSVLNPFAAVLEMV